ELTSGEGPVRESPGEAVQAVVDRLDLGVGVLDRAPGIVHERDPLAAELLVPRAVRVGGLAQCPRQVPQVGDAFAEAREDVLVAGPAARPAVPVPPVTRVPRDRYVVTRVQPSALAGETHRLPRRVELV